MVKRKPSQALLFDAQVSNSEDDACLCQIKDSQLPLLQSSLENEVDCSELEKVDVNGL